MKLIIAGGRDFTPTAEWHNKIYALVESCGATEIVSGACKGADAFGEYIAALAGIKVTRFPALWHKHGRAAGPIRNKEMAQYADAVILLPGGAGTDSMRREAVAAGIRIIYDARGKK